MSGEVVFTIAITIIAIISSPILLILWNPKEDSTKKQ